MTTEIAHIRDRGRSRTATEKRRNFLTALNATSFDWSVAGSLKPTGLVLASSGYLTMSLTDSSQVHGPASEWPIAMVAGGPSIITEAKSGILQTVNLPLAPGGR